MLHEYYEIQDFSLQVFGQSSEVLVNRFLNAHDNASLIWCCLRVEGRAMIEPSPDLRCCLADRDFYGLVLELCFQAFKESAV